MKRVLTVPVTTFATLFFVAIMMFSCQKDTSLPPLSSDIGGTGDKYLEFKDRTEFDNKLLDLSKKSRKELDDWDKSNNFTSLRSLYEKIVEEEEANILKEEEVIKQNPELKSTMKHKYSSLLKQTTETISYSTNGVELNLFDPRLANLVNKDGIVKIGNVLHKFSRDHFKMIMDGDYNKVKDLSNITQDNQTANLQYIKVFLSFGPVKNGKTSNDVGCSNESNGYRLDGSAVGYSYYEWAPQYGQWVLRYSAYVKSTHRRYSSWWGWVSRSTSIYRSFGNWGIRYVSQPNIFGLPAADVLTAYDQTAFSGETSNAYLFFTIGTKLVGGSAVFGNVGSIGGITDLRIYGDFNFEFYDCKCSVNIQ